MCTDLIIPKLLPTSYFQKFLSKSWKYIFAKGMFITNIKTYGMSVTNKEIIFGMPLRFLMWFFPSDQAGWHFLIPFNSSPCSVDLNTSLSESLPVHCQNHCPLFSTFTHPTPRCHRTRYKSVQHESCYMTNATGGNAQSTHLTCGTYLRPQYAIFRLKLRIED